MKLFAFLVLASIVCSALSIDQWEEYKKKFRKRYVSGSDEDLRKQTWLENNLLIDKHNSEADAGLHTYWLTMNEFGDLSKKEFAQLFAGVDLTLDKYVKPNKIFEYDPSRVVPESIDWRTKGYVTKVKHQGKPRVCGSCYAFAVVGALEGQHFRKTGYLIDLSAQHLVDCTNNKKYNNNGCVSGVPKNTYKYIQANNGISSQANYPYVANDRNVCNFDPSKLVAPITGFEEVPQIEDALKQAVATIGPVVVLINTKWAAFQFYSRGVISFPKETTCLKNPNDVNHAVLAIGYGTDEGDYWLLKNSLGTGWGIKGYFKLVRNNDNNCGIARHASYPTVD